MKSVSDVGNSPSSASGQPVRTAAGQLALYGAMAFPLAFAGLPIYLHAPDFYAVNFGQSLTTLGTVLLLLRLVDAFQDPLIGSLSDRFETHRGKILATGAVLLGTGLLMLFNPSAQAPLAWFAVSILICTTGFSVVSINFQTLGGLWNVGRKDRTAVTASREAAGLAGLLVASILPALLVRYLDPPEAFRWLSLGYIPLLVLALWLLLRWMRFASFRKPVIPRSSGSWRQLGNRWRYLFFGLVFLSTFASAIPAVLVLFFIRDRLGAEANTGLFLLIYFLAGAASMPLWTRLARVFGKIRTWQVSMATAILTFSWAALLQPGDIVAYSLVCILSGFALGAELALPPALLADHIDADRSEQEASRLFAVMAFLSKSALAIATGLALPLLGWFGYQPGAPMTPALGFALSLSYAGLPSLFKLVALFGLIYFEKDLAKLKNGV